MTALFSPSMPIEMAPERLTFAFSSRMTLAFGFFSFAFSAAIGPAVPPPITSTSHAIPPRSVADFVHRRYPFRVNDGSCRADRPARRGRAMEKFRGRDRRKM